MLRKRTIQIGVCPQRYVSGSSPCTPDQPRNILEIGALAAVTEPLMLRRVSTELRGRPVGAAWGTSGIKGPAQGTNGSVGVEQV